MKKFLLLSIIFLLSGCVGLVPKTSIKENNIFSCANPPLNIQIDKRLSFVSHFSGEKQISKDLREQHDFSDRIFQYYFCNLDKQNEKILEALIITIYKSEEHIPSGFIPFFISYRHKCVKSEYVDISGIQFEVCGFYDSHENFDTGKFKFDKDMGIAFITVTESKGDDFDSGDSYDHFMETGEFKKPPKDKNNALVEIAYYKDISGVDKSSKWDSLKSAVHKEFEHLLNKDNSVFEILK